MARPLRVEYAGAYYHVINRGNAPKYFEEVLRAVCEELGCSANHILAKGKKANKARDLAIYLSRDLSGKTCKELGEYFGGITGPGITMRYNRVNNKMKQDRKLKRKLVRIKKQLVII